MSERFSEINSVRKEISIIAGPRGWGDTRASWLARVSRRIPTVSFRTVKALWYGEISDPEHWAAREIRREAKLIFARREAKSLAEQYQKIIGEMRNANSDLYHTDVARLERLVGILSDQIES